MRSVLSNDYPDGYDDGYKKGLIDAWDLAKKVVLLNRQNGSVLHALFSTRDSEKVFINFSVTRALDIIKKYEEEQAKLVCGDFVSYMDCDIKATGIFLVEDELNYYVLTKRYSAPQVLPKAVFELKKTGLKADFDNLWR